MFSWHQQTLCEAGPCNTGVKMKPGMCQSLASLALITSALLAAVLVLLLPCSQLTWMPLLMKYEMLSVKVNWRVCDVKAGVCAHLMYRRHACVYCPCLQSHIHLRNLSHHHPVFINSTDIHT